MTSLSGHSASISTSQSSLSTSTLPPFSSPCASSSSSYSGPSRLSTQSQPGRRVALNTDADESDDSEGCEGWQTLTWVKPPPVVGTYTAAPQSVSQIGHSAPLRLSTQSGKFSLSLDNQDHRAQPYSIPRRTSRPPKPSEKIRALQEPPPSLTRPKKKSPQKPGSNPPMSLPTPPSLSLITTSSCLRMKKHVPDVETDRVGPRRRKGIHRTGRTSSLVEKVLDKEVEEAETESMPVGGRFAGRKRACEENEGGEEGIDEDDGNAGMEGQYEEYPVLADCPTSSAGRPYCSDTDRDPIKSLSTRSPSAKAPQDPLEFPDEEELVDQELLWDDWAFEEEGHEKRIAERLSDGVLDPHLLPEEDQAVDDLIPEYGGNEEGDEGEKDGDMLAKLLARAERMREGLPEAEAEGEVLEDEEEGLLLDDMDDCEADEALEEDRRERALAHLETIIIKFLSQLHASTSILNVYEKKRFQSKGSQKGKGAKKDQEGSDGEENTMLLEEPEEKLGKGGTVGVDWGHVGIELGLLNRKTGAQQVVSFPDDPTSMGSKGGSQQRLAEILRVAVLMYEAVLTKTVTTKRDIFYKDVNLFKTQSTVDKLVDDIAASAGLKRQDFMVCATSKGLVASSALKVILRSGEELGFSATNASLIPPLERIDYIDSEIGLDWVLIVEKDAVFQTLCSTGILAREELGTGAIITGKGYPDLATLQLSALIAVTFPSARFYSLVDADPHGLDILSVYTNGSRATRYSYDHADLALGERLEWMGVKATEWDTLGVEFDDLLPLSEKDVQKAMAMLTTRPEMPNSWKRELVHMLHLNRKAEIQVLATRRQSLHHFEATGPNIAVEENGIVGYITERLLRGRE